MLLFHWEIPELLGTNIILFGYVEQIFLNILWSVLVLHGAEKRQLLPSPA